MDKNAKHHGHNHNIACEVPECRYHDTEKNYCTLEGIKIVKHESRANTIESTDCGSFEKS